MESQWMFFLLYYVWYITTVFCLNMHSMSQILRWCFILLENLPYLLVLLANKKIYEVKCLYNFSSFFSFIFFFILNPRWVQNVDLNVRGLSSWVMIGLPIYSCYEFDDHLEILQFEPGCTTCIISIIVSFINAFNQIKM